ncbi:helix-turn-helix transcriptional regulator [Nocardia sp. NPDC046763]|uniref:helix-turn-helix transcriptional regulator n=1 Tax=Nocardia sp. NPDC046763 TaxID=3155256 RepID=UPI0033C696FF
MVREGNPNGRCARERRALDFLREATVAQISVVRALVVIEESASEGVLVSMLGISPESMRDYLDQLRAADVVEGLRLHSRRVKDVVLQAIPLDIRRRLHHDAAAALYRAGAAETAIATQIVRAGYARHPWAFAVLQAAADSAVRADRIDSAVSYLEAAYRLASGPDEKASATTQLVLLEWRANPSASTRNFTRMVTALHAGHNPVRLLPALAHYLLWHGRLDDAEIALRDLKRRATAYSDVSGSAVRYLRTSLAYEYPAMAERHETQLAAVQARITASDKLAAVCGDVQLEAATLVDTLLGGRIDATLVEAAEAVLRENRLSSDTVPALAVALDCLIYADRLDTATAWCDALVAEAEARGTSTWGAIFSLRQAEAVLRRGDLETAERFATQSLNHVRGETLGNLYGRAVAVVAKIMTAAGNHDQAEAQLRQRFPDSMFESRYALDFLHARGHHLLATGQTACAMGDFIQAGQLAKKWRLDNPVVVPWRNDVAMAHLRLGQPDLAHHYATQQLDLVRRSPVRRSGGVSLRLIAATVEPAERIELLERAADIARTIGDQLELATVLAELGWAEEEVGNRSRSRALLRRATQVAKTCGARPLWQSLTGGDAQQSAEPADPAPATHAVEHLSASELRVAELASDGRRNKEIALQLGITTSTVEQHLTRVYRKLKVSRRTDLRRALNRLAVPLERRMNP